MCLEVTVTATHIYLPIYCETCLSDNMFTPSVRVQFCVYFFSVDGIFKLLTECIKLLNGNGQHCVPPNDTAAA